MIKENNLIIKQKGLENNNLILDELFVKLPFIDGFRFQVGNISHDYKDHKFHTSCDYWGEEGGSVLIDDCWWNWFDFENIYEEYLEIKELYNDNINLINEYKKLETFTKKDLKKYKDVIEILDFYNSDILMMLKNIGLLKEDIEYIKIDDEYYFTNLVTDNIYKIISEYTTLLDKNILKELYFPEFNGDGIEIIELYKDKTYIIIEKEGVSDYIEEHDHGY